MNFKELLELIDKVAESGIGSVEVEQAGTKVRIEGKSAPAPVHVSSENNVAFAAPAPPQTPAQIETARVEERKRVEEEAEAGLHIITSPIVGTYYRSPNPEASPFVNVGDRVTKGKVLCIIEAMKLMNEIDSEYDGEVVNIYVENGQAVQYGERLFAIRLK